MLVQRATSKRSPANPETFWVSFRQTVKGRGICRQGEKNGEEEQRELDSIPPLCCQAQASSLPMSEAHPAHNPLWAHG
eukprot:196601-Pelagomonas_calceolata.AAC.1